MNAPGQSAFDAARLRATLDDTRHEAPVAAAQIEQYRAYYDLDGLADQHLLWVVEHGAERIVAQAFEPSRPTSWALLCHGYYDHVGLYGNVLEYLLDRGVAVLTYDQLGHGLSSGERVSIDSFDQYVAATEAVLQSARSIGVLAHTPQHWVGQSMGGAVLLEYFQQHHVDQLAGNLVLFAPLIRPYAWPLNRWVFEIAKLTITERARTLANNAENPEFQALQRRDPLQAHVLPVRWVQAMYDWFMRFERYPGSRLAPKIVQGYADRTVSWRHNLKTMRRRYPNSELLIIPEARHHLVNESSSIRQLMWDWFDRECAWSEAHRYNAPLQRQETEFV